MTNLVNLYLTVPNRTVTSTGYTKQRKQVAGFDGIFKTQRDHVVVAKTYLNDPSQSLCFQERGQQTETDTLTRSLILKHSFFVSSFYLKPVLFSFPRRRGSKGTSQEDIQCAKQVSCKMLVHVIITTPCKEGVITHIVPLRKIKSQKAHTAKQHE